MWVFFFLNVRQSGLCNASSAALSKVFAKRRSDRWELVRAGQAEKKQPKKLSVCTIIWNHVGMTVEKDHHGKMCKLFIPLLHLKVVKWKRVTIIEKSFQLSFSLCTTLQHQ